MTLCLNDDVGGSESVGQKPKFYMAFKDGRKVKSRKTFLIFHKLSRFLILNTLMPVGNIKVAHT